MNEWGNRMSLGQLIHQRRKYLHLTQEQLASKIHVSKSAIAKWETDGGIPDRDNLKRLSIEIGVSVDDLYRIIDSHNMMELDVNITNDVIVMLESYGYTVIPPENKNTTEEDL